MKFPEVFTYFILIAVSVAVALLAIKNIIISPDSMTYSLVSQQILAGNGIRIPMIWLDSNAVPVDGTVPMLMHPPLLPMLLALLGGITPQSFLAAQILNVICHVILTIFTFLIMKNVCDKGIALLTGILVSISFPLLKVSHHASSETLFIALTTASIYFLITSRHSNGYRYTWKLFLASIFASAAIMTRNTGVAIVAVFFWEALVLLKNKRSIIRFGSIIMAIAIPVITVTTLFVRNFQISGIIRGYNQPPIKRDFLSAVTGTLDMLFSQFQLGRRSVTLIIILAVLFIIYVFINADLRRELLTYFNAGMDSLIVFIIGYTLLICYAMAEKQPRFEIRFMSPLVPFLFIVSILVLVVVWKTIQFQRLPRLSLVGMILSLCLLAFINMYKTYLNVPEFFYKQDKVYSILKSCTYTWIRENYGKNSIIATNMPYHLSFFGGYSTVILPHKRWAPKTHIPDSMESVLPSRMSDTGAQVLALFEEVSADYYGSHVAGLFSKKQINHKLSPVYECQDGIVYHLKQ